MNTAFQPPPKIFNNPTIIAKGWYFACLSQEIPQKKAKSIDLCNQRIVLFEAPTTKSAPSMPFAPTSAPI
jgi:phenylpropionate dioxygenase-like ring-hydroxylating dioxygenase large terminal subunit